MRGTLSTHAQAMAEARRTRAPDRFKVPYALFVAGRERPYAFADLDGLARSIQRRRQGRRIQLTNVSYPFFGEIERRTMVAIYILSTDAIPESQIGLAWLAGLDSRALQAALRAADPEGALNAMRAA